MNFEKGYCRIELKSGLIAYGELLEIKDEYIMFKGFSPVAIEEKIKKRNIVKYEKCEVDDIPPYE